MKRMSRFGMEREARFKAAWGQVGASLRQLRFNEELSRQEEGIRRARHTEEKDALKAQKDTFVKKAKSDHALHVGFC